MWLLCRNRQYSSSSISTRSIQERPQQAHVCFRCLRASGNTLGFASVVMEIRCELSALCGSRGGDIVAQGQPFTSRRPSSASIASSTSLHSPLSNRELLAFRNPSVPPLGCTSSRYNDAGKIESVRRGLQDESQREQFSIPLLQCVHEIKRERERNVGSNNRNRRHKWSARS